MASINGVTIKNIKKFRGHEYDEVLQGNVYLNNKKLGFWSQDDWGGSDTYYFDTSSLKSALGNYKNGFSKDYRYFKLMDDPEIFFGDLAKLILLESSFKPYFKKGYKAIVAVMNSYDMCWLPIPEDGENDELLSRYSEQVKQAENDIGGDKKVFVFRADDFDIVVDGSHKAPAYLRQ